MIKIQNQELANKIKEKFKEYMKERGYEIWKSETPNYGITYTASKESDRYVPLIELQYGSNYRYKISEYEISVKDRDGENGLYGEIVASYYLHSEYETDEEIIMSEFNRMLDDVYTKYSKYSRENRLDSVFNNLESEDFNYIENKREFNIRELKGIKRKNEVM